METDPFVLFKNCSGLSDQQITVGALARGITPAICGIVLCVVLVAMITFSKCYYQRICGTFLKQVAIVLTASSAVYLLVLSLNLVHYYHPQVQDFCAAIGFLIQYFGTLLIVLMLGIIFVLFFKILKVTTLISWKLVDEYYEKARQSNFIFCGRKINKLVVVFYASTFVLPLLYNWIPFVTNSYGSWGPSCGIFPQKYNCSTNSEWELVIWLNIVPFGIVAVLTLGLFTASLCLLGYGIRNARVEKLVLMEVGITDSLIFVIFFVLRYVPFQVRIIIQDSFIVSVVYDITTPLTFTLIPLALLIAIHLPLSSMLVRAFGKHQRNLRECDQATLHESSDWSVLHQPSYTTWNPLHSSNDNSENLPLFSNHQQDNYGSN